VCKKCGTWLSVPIGHTSTLQRHTASHNKAVSSDPSQPKLTSFTRTKTEVTSAKQCYVDVTTPNCDDN